MITIRNVKTENRFKNISLIRSIFYITIIHFILSSCCKKPKPETFLLNEDLKKYTYFNQNTFWIYQDSVSNKKDTVNVTSSKTQIIEMSDAAASQKKCDVYDFSQSFTSKVYSSFSQKEYEISGSTICMYHPPPNSFCYTVHILEDNSDKPFYYFFWEPIINSSLTQYAHRATLTDTYTSVTFNGRIFNDVVKMKSEFYNPSDLNQLMRTEYRYFAKNLGVIRTEIQGDSLIVWNLINENIIQ